MEELELLRLVSIRNYYEKKRNLVVFIDPNNDELKEGVEFVQAICLNQFDIAYINNKDRNGQNIYPENDIINIFMRRYYESGNESVNLSILYLDYKVAGNQSQVNEDFWDIYFREIFNPFSNNPSYSAETQLYNYMGEYSFVYGLISDISSPNLNNIMLNQQGININYSFVFDNKKSSWIISLLNYAIICLYDIGGGLYDILNGLRFDNQSSIMSYSISSRILNSNINRRIQGEQHQNVKRNMLGQELEVRFTEELLNDYYNQIPLYSLTDMAIAFDKISEMSRMRNASIELSYMDLTGLSAESVLNHLNDLQRGIVKNKVEEWKDYLINKLDSWQLDGEGKAELIRYLYNMLSKWKGISNDIKSQILPRMKANIIIEFADKSNIVNIYEKMGMTEVNKYIDSLKKVYIFQYIIEQVTSFVGLSVNPAKTDSSLEQLSYKVADEQMNAVNIPMQAIESAKSKMQLENTTNTSEIFILSNDKYNIGNHHILNNCLNDDTVIISKICKIER